MSRTHLGEEGTEQFTVTTHVNNKLVAAQPIHDPFIHSTVSHYLSRWAHFKQVFAPKTIRIQVSVDGSHSVMRAIMTLDPEQLQREEEEFLCEQAKRREENGVMGYYAEASAKA